LLAGFESDPGDRVCTFSLREVRKLQNTHDDLLEAVHAIQRHGIEVVAGMILGFDNDPENIFDEQIDFLQQAGAANVLVSLLFAFPNTPLYDRLKREKRLVNFSPGEQVYIPSTLFPYAENNSAKGLSAGAGDFVFP
jgi:radical SAM superfamily enzyme YgiQ (UPF0313 family)